MGDRLERSPTDFSRMAARVVGGLDGAVCVIATRDGLPLGVYPGAEERRIVSRWTELGSGVTTAVRGFLVRDEEAWAIATSRRYAAVAVVGVSVRPGFVLQRLEDALEALESTVGAQDRPPLPFHDVRHREAPQEPEVSPDMIEVARVLGRLADAPQPDLEPAPWPVPDRAGSIGA